MIFIINILLGMLTAKLLSKPAHNKTQEIIIGALGALAVSPMIIGSGSYEPFSFLEVMLATMLVIYFGRLINIFPIRLSQI